MSPGPIVASSGCDAPGADAAAVADDAFESPAPLSVQDLLSGGSDGLSELVSLAYDDFRRVSEIMLRSVDWEDPFIRGVILFHGVMFVTAILVRRSWNALRLLFCLNVGVFMGVQFGAPWLSRHASAYARHDYFDKHGVFMSHFIGFPIILSQLVIVVLMTWHVMRMMKRTKRAQKVAEARFEASRKARQARAAQQKEAMHAKKE